jgi:hypothetical protein
MKCKLIGNILIVILLSSPVILLVSSCIMLIKDTIRQNEICNTFCVEQLYLGGNKVRKGICECYNKENNVFLYRVNKLDR